MPVAKACRLEHRRHSVRDGTVCGIMHVLHCPEATGGTSERNAFEQPQHEDRRDDDRAGAGEESPEAPHHGAHQRDGARALVWRQAHDEWLRGEAAERRVFEHQSHQEDHENRHDVHEEDDEPCVLFKERIGKHQIYGEARRAGCERDEHAYEHALTGIRQCARGSQAGKVAAKAYDYGQERAPVQSERPHGAVHDESRARQIPAVLQEGQQYEHDAHRRDERGDGDDAVEQSVDDEGMEPAVCCAWPEQAKAPIDPGLAPAAHGHVEPILRGAGKRGGCLEHREHDDEEHDDAPHRMEQHLVNAVGQRQPALAAHADIGQHACRPFETFVAA